MRRLWGGVLVLFVLAGPACWGAESAGGTASGSLASGQRAQKLALAEAIYAPVFAQIRYEDAKAGYAIARRKKGLAPGEMSRQQFEAAKNLIYQSFADALTLEDLQLQKKVAATAVGQRMLSDIPRSFSGLPPLPLSREQFTAAQWQAFENIVQQNRAQFSAMSQRMREFPAVFRRHIREEQARQGSR